MVTHEQDETYVNVWVFQGRAFNNYYVLSMPFFIPEWKMKKCDVLGCRYRRKNDMITRWITSDFIIWYIFSMFIFLPKAKFFKISKSKMSRG